MIICVSRSANRFYGSTGPAGQIKKFYGEAWEFGIFSVRDVDH